MTRSALSRRRVLGLLGTGVVGALAGCNNVGINGEPRYERREIGDLKAGNRSPEEVTAAEAIATQEATQGVTPLNSLTITKHEFVLKDGYLGPTVQGIVRNTGENRIKLAEVRVRVFNASGNQLGRYLAVTGDLNGGATWKFQVVILESPADIDRYDITVLGTPA